MHRDLGSHADSSPGRWGSLIWLAFFGVWLTLQVELMARESDDSSKKYNNSIYIYELATQAVWCRMGAVARWVILPSRWYPTVYLYAYVISMLIMF